MPIEPAPPRTAPAKISRTFRAINGLRGPGSIAIAFAHLAVALELVRYDSVAPISMVVDMFFVFSGIVIAQAYAEKLARPSAIPEYIVRRFGRIWPVQAAVLVVLVFYELAKLIAASAFGTHFSAAPFSSSGADVAAIPTNLLLIHSLGIHDHETWNFPSWSLSVEFAAYILFALICILRPALRYVVSVAAIIASILVLVFVAPYHMRSTFDYGIFRCVAGFLAGTLCRDIAVRWDLPRYPFPTLVEVLAVGLFVVWLVFSAGTYAAFAAPLVINLFLMILVAERGLLSRALATKPLQLLAEASFSIYMVHAVVLIFVLAALHEYAHLTNQTLFFDVANPLAGRPGATPTVQVFHADHPAVAWTVAILYFASVFLATYVIYRWIEVPGRAAFGRLAKRIDATIPGSPGAAGNRAHTLTRAR